MSSKNFKVKEGLDVSGSINAGGAINAEYTQNYLFGFGGGDIKFVGDTASAGYGSIGCAPVTNGSTIVRLGSYSPEYSIDGGSTWVAQGSSGVTFSSTYGQSLAYGNGIFVFAYSDQSTEYIYTSTDGISWTQRLSDGWGATSYNTTSVCFENGYFFRSRSTYNDKALSDAVALYYSTDAITWTIMFGGAINRSSIQYPVAPMSLTDRKEVTYLNGQYIWMHGGNSIYYCTTPQTSSSSDFVSVSFATGYVGTGAIAYDSVSNTYLVTSFNGTNSSSVTYLISGLVGVNGLAPFSSSSIDYSLGTQSYTGAPLINYGGQIYLFLDGGVYVTLSSINQSPMGTTVTWNTPVSGLTSPTRVMSQSVAMQMNLVDSVLALSSAPAPVVNLETNVQTGSWYDLVATDNGKIVEMNNSSANMVVVPNNDVTSIPVGAQINILQTGTGQTTITGDQIMGGVTINGTPGLKLRDQWSSATLIKRATNTWVLVGDLIA